MHSDVISRLYYSVIPLLDKEIPVYTGDYRVKPDNDTFISLVDDIESKSPLRCPSSLFPSNN